MFAHVWSNNEVPEQTVCSDRGACGCSLLGVEWVNYGCWKLFRVCLLHECLENGAFSGLVLLLRLFLAVLHRCSWGRLFNAKGDPLDWMWPSGPHLAFGLLVLLALIRVVKRRMRRLHKFGQLNLIRLLNPFFRCFEWRDGGKACWQKSVCFKGGWLTAKTVDGSEVRTQPTSWSGVSLGTGFA